MKLSQIQPSGLFEFLALPGTAKLFADGVLSMGGRLAAHDVIDLIQKGTMQLWAARDGSVIKAIVLSEIVQYPCLKVLRLFGLSGSGFPDLVSLLPQIEAFGLDHGCREMDAIETRAGLELAVPGFRRTGVCLVKPLEPMKAVA